MSSLPISNNNQNNYENNQDDDYTSHHVKNINDTPSRASESATTMEARKEHIVVVSRRLDLAASSKLSGIDDDDDTNNNEGHPSPKNPSSSSSSPSQKTKTSAFTTISTLFSKSSPSSSASSSSCLPKCCLESRQIRVAQKYFLSFYIPNFCVSIGTALFATLLPISLRELGESDSLTGLIVALVGIGRVIADVPSTLLSHKVGPLWIMALSIAVAAVVFALPTMDFKLWAFITAQAIGGLPLAGYATPRLEMLQFALPTAERNTMASHMGAGARISFLVGPLIGGFAYHYIGSSWAYLFSSAFFVIALVATIASRDLSEINRKMMETGQFGGVHVISVSTIEKDRKKRKEQEARRREKEAKKTHKQSVLLNLLSPNASPRSSSKKASPVITRTSSVENKNNNNQADEQPKAENENIQEDHDNVNERENNNNNNINDENVVSSSSSSSTPKSDHSIGTETDEQSICSNRPSHALHNINCNDDTVEERDDDLNDVDDHENNNLSYQEDKNNTPKEIVVATEIQPSPPPTKINAQQNFTISTGSLRLNNNNNNNNQATKSFTSPPVPILSLPGSPLSVKNNMSNTLNSNNSSMMMMNNNNNAGRPNRSNQSAMYFQNFSGPILSSTKLSTQQQQQQQQKTFESENNNNNNNNNNDSTEAPLLQTRQRLETNNDYGTTTLLENEESGASNYSDGHLQQNGDDEEEHDQSLAEQQQQQQPQERGGKHSSTSVFWLALSDHWARIVCIGILALTTTSLRQGRRLALTFRSLNLGYSAKEVGYIMALSFSIDSFFFWLSPIITNRFGYRAAVVPMCLIYCGAFILLSFDESSTDNATLLGAAVVFGIADVAGAGLMLSIIGEMCPRPLVGLARSFVDLGVMVGPLATGGLSDSVGFSWACRILAGWSLFGVLWAIVILPGNIGKELDKWMKERKEVR